jgi:hypothetical protein
MLIVMNSYEEKFNQIYFLYIEDIYRHKLVENKA